MESAQAVAQMCVQVTAECMLPFYPAYPVSYTVSQGTEDEAKLKSPSGGIELVLGVRCLATLSCLLGVTAAGGSGPG